MNRFSKVRNSERFSQPCLQHRRELCRRVQLQKIRHYIGFPILACVVGQAEIIRWFEKTIEAADQVQMMSLHDKLVAVQSCGLYRGLSAALESLEPQPLSFKSRGPAHPHIPYADPTGDRTEDQTEDQTETKPSPVLFPVWSLSGGVGMENGGGIPPGLRDSKQVTLCSLLGSLLCGVLVNSGVEGE